VAVSGYALLLAVYCLMTFWSCQSFDLYGGLRLHPPLFLVQQVSKAVGIVTLLLSALLYMTGTSAVPATVVLISGLLNVAVFSGWRLWAGSRADRRIRAGQLERKVLIVGYCDLGRAVENYLTSNPEFGYRVLGYVDHVPSTDAKILGTIGDLASIARAHFADEILVTLPPGSSAAQELAAQVQQLRVDVKAILDFGEGWAIPPEMPRIGQLPAVLLHREPIPAIALLTKRALDVTLATLALIAALPILVIAALAIRLESAGPVFYGATRVGKRGRFFRCYKLRTMVANADELKKGLLHLNERQGPFFKIEKDPRITRLGHWLRKYSIDELPQFWNVLKGDMSIVGPRPHPVDDFRQYTPEHMRRLDVAPGITGLWQVTARRDPSFERNLRLDLDYIENWTPALDIKILLRTFSAVLSGGGS
jgi:exopolysaccharide biosynthesis polyprenyl glycosylphosphotransferase